MERTPRTKPDDRRMLCQICGAYCGEQHGSKTMPVGLVFTRAKCPRCNKWRWFDVANSAMVERPPDEV